MARKKTNKFQNITVLSRSSPKTLHSTTVTNITGRGQGRVTVSHSVTRMERALDGIEDTLQDVGVMLLDENDDSTSVPPPPPPPPPPHPKVKRPPVSLYPFSLSLIFFLSFRTALLKTGCPTIRKPLMSSYVLTDWVTWMRLACAYAAGLL